MIKAIKIGRLKTVGAIDQSSLDKLVEVNMVKLFHDSCGSVHFKALASSELKYI